MKTKQQNNIVYKGTHQDFSMKANSEKKEQNKTGQKVFRSAILPILLILAGLIAIFGFSGTSTGATLTPALFNFLGNVMHF